MKRKILIVDDHADILNLLEAVLKSKFEVFSFISAEEALVRISEINPDLVVSDIVLPGMNGYEFCSHLQGHDDWKALPLILLSSKSGSNARSTGYKLGAIHYLEKPFDPSEILALVESILRRDELVRPKGLTSIILERENLKMDILRSTCTYAGRAIKLTKSEMLILSKLLRNFEIVCSRLSLVEAIESEAFNDRILDTYVKSLRKKLEFTELQISTIYGKGYKIEKV